MHYNVLLVASEEALHTLDISKFTHDSFTSLETTERIYHHPDRQLKNTVRKASRCELLVTIGDWSENASLRKLVDIARMMNITIIHETNFQKYVDQSENN